MCLIDLHKGGLLHVLRSLPHHLVVPAPIRYGELLSFTSQEWTLLDKGGMETWDLTSDMLRNASAFHSKYGGLSPYDCACLAMAQRQPHGILLTSDKRLREAAETEKVEAHGILWVIDQLKAANACDDTLLVNALQIWQEDPTVRLPPALIDQRIRRLTQPPR